VELRNESIHRKLEVSSIKGQMRESVDMVLT